MYRLLKYIIFFSILFLSINNISAQDYNFSQFWENRTYYNPAFTGIKMGELNSTLTYRKLWPNLDGNFTTVHFAMDMKTYNSYGLGLNFISSDEGGGFIKTNSIGLSYSWRGYFNKEKDVFFQLGVTGRFNNESLNTNKYIFSTQLDPIYGNIFPKPELEGMKKNQNYFDFSTGVVVGLPVRIYYEHMMYNYFGLAIHHLTRPKDNFIEEDPKIPMRITLQWHSAIETGLYSFDRRSKLQIRPGFIFENQGDKPMSSSSFNNFTIGTDVATDPLFAGIWYSSQLLNKSDENYETLIFKLGFKLDSEDKRFQYKLTYTYDMSLGNLVKSTEGSHEIGFCIVYRFNAKYSYNIFAF